MWERELEGRCHKLMSIFYRLLVNSQSELTQVRDMQQEEQQNPTALKASVSKVGATVNERKEKCLNVWSTDCK